MPEVSRVRQLVARASLAGALLALAITPAFADTAIVKLTGEDEAPAVDSDAFGECLVTLNEAQTEIAVQCSHTADSPIAWHIHRAPAGTSGPIVLNPAPDPGASPLEATFQLNEELLGALLTEQLYINVHTTAVASGEIRGQIRMQHDFNDIATTLKLDGDQETPPIDSSFTGTCRASLNPQTSMLRVACTHNVTDAIAAHFHAGARGVAGPIDVDFGDPSSPIIREIALDSDEVGRFLSGGWYVNVHSPAHPSGEIRGQVDGCLESKETLCLEQGRFEVQIGFTDHEGQEFSGQSVKEGDDSGMFWFLGPNNLEILVKVLNACSFNQRFWVFFAATTDVAFDLSVTDKKAGVTKNYSNPLGHPADAVTDTDAFSTCP
jgi:hypothetical protein